MMRFAALLLPLTLALLLPATASAQTEPYCPIEDMGSGVLYFDCRSMDFALTLSTWKKLHPNKIITAMAGNGTGTYGYDRGYVVVTEDREK